MEFPVQNKCMQFSITDIWQSCQMIKFRNNSFIHKRCWNYATSPWEGWLKNRNSTPCPPRQSMNNDNKLISKSENFKTIRRHCSHISLWPRNMQQLLRYNTKIIQICISKLEHFGQWISILRKSNSKSLTQNTFENHILDIKCLEKENI